MFRKKQTPQPPTHAKKTFILDCTDRSKSKLPPYDPRKDKYMRYAIPPSIVKYVQRLSQPPSLDKNSFDSFLRSERERVLEQRQLKN